MKTSRRNSEISSTQLLSLSLRGTAAGTGSSCASTGYQSWFSFSPRSLWLTRREGLTIPSLPWSCNGLLIWAGSVISSTYGIGWTTWCCKCLVLWSSSRSHKKSTRAWRNLTKTGYRRGIWRSTRLTYATERTLHLSWKAYRSIFQLERNLELLEGQAQENRQ